MTKVLIKFIMIYALFSIPYAHCFGEDLTYEFGAQIALQYSGYYGDEDPEEGFILPEDEFIIRKAALSLEGMYGEYLSFELEMGSERCPFSSSDNVRILEGNIFFQPVESFKVGFSRGHVLRGYQLRHDCTDLMTGEKVRWASVVAGCHPTGIVAHFNYEYSESSVLELELSYNNGPKSNTLDNEHDINFGFNYRTFLDGLSITGFFSDIEADFDLDQTRDDGNRMGLGARFDNNKFTLGGEYYFINGAASPFDEIDSSDLEMRAYYIESGYEFDIGKMITYIQPYARFQSWDKGNNVQGDHEYEYMDFGIIFGLSGYDAFLKAEYETRVGEPDGVINEEDKLIIRLQINI